MKIGPATAGEICATASLKKDLLQDGMGPREFIAALLDKKKNIEAIDFMAHALPPREGIWWGCLCMQHACGDQLTPPERAAAKATVEWVMQPDEDRRAAAKGPAETATAGSAAWALAIAVTQAAPGLPGASAKSVAMVVKIASTKAEPIKIEATQRSYVELGIEIAEGRHLG